MEAPHAKTMQAIGATFPLRKSACRLHRGGGGVTPKRAPGLRSRGRDPDDHDRAHDGRARAANRDELRQPSLRLDAGHEGAAIGLVLTGG